MAFFIWSVVGIVFMIFGLYVGSYYHNDNIYGGN